MILLLALILAGTYVALATWAVRGQGSGTLWVVAIGLLLAVVLSAVLISLWYDVPSVLRVILYALTFCGPVVLLPTVLLSFSKTRGVALRASLPIALVGTVLGLGCGFVLVIYGLGVW